MNRRDAFERGVERARVSVRYDRQNEFERMMAREMDELREEMGRLWVEVGRRRCQ